MLAEKVKNQEEIRAAVNDGNIEEVIYLLSTGVNIDCIKINYRSSSFCTLLMLALRKENTDMVTVLLNRGADPNKAVTSILHGVGWTPLHEAALNGHKDAVQLLLDAGADPNRGNGVFRTPLGVAVVCGHKDVVQLLLDRGADPNEADEAGFSPLHWVKDKGHKDVVQLLLDKGADPNRADLSQHTGCCRLS